MDNDLQPADLRERLARLEAENSELRNRLAATDAPPRRRSRMRLSGSADRVGRCSPPS